MASGRMDIDAQVAPDGDTAGGGAPGSMQANARGSAIASSEAPRIDPCAVSPPASVQPPSGIPHAGDPAAMSRMEPR